MHGSAGGALTIAIRIGRAPILAHSLKLRLALLLHSTLDTACLHMGIGRNFRLYGVTFENLSERKGHHKKGHYDYTDEYYYEYC